MLIFLILIAVFNPSSPAPLLSPPDPLDPPNPFIVFGRELPQCIDPAYHRTMQDIVWSCLTTIFICTWVAVHPNVPDPRDSQWTVLKQRVTIMIYAVVGPEFVMMWALRQRIGAAKHVREYNKKFHDGDKAPGWSIRNYFRPRAEDSNGGPWTLTHGFLLEMRGLRKYEDGKPAGFLEFVHNPERLRLNNSACFVEDPFEMTEEEINDKSKGNFLTKLLVVLQTTWFVFQCLARWFMHLPVTELEVITLAFASLNIITYILWWNKPQNMRFAIPIHVDHVSTPPASESGCQEPEGTDLPQGSLFIRVGRRTRWQSFIYGYEQMSFLPLDWRDINIKEWLLFLATPIKPLLSMILSAPSTTTLHSSYMFYASENGLGNQKVYVSFCFIATGFGFLHLIPIVISIFPSDHETDLWLASALVIIIQPMLMLYTGVVVLMVGTDTTKYIIFFVIFIGNLGYVIARIILILLAFTSLRNLPSGAYQGIAWTTFIPHF